MFLSFLGLVRFGGLKKEQTSVILPGIGRDCAAKGGNRSEKKNTHTIALEATMKNKHSFARIGNYTGEKEGFRKVQKAGLSKVLLVVI